MKKHHDATDSSQVIKQTTTSTKIKRTTTTRTDKKQTIAVQQYETDEHFGSIDKSFEKLEEGNLKNFIFRENFLIAKK